MSKYQQVQLDATPHQLLRLAHGHNVQFKYSQLLTGHPITLHVKTARSVHRAHRHQRGVRIQLTAEELNHNIQHGSGKFLDALKKAGSWIKQNIIDTPFYQDNIKPVVRGVVNQGVDAFSGIATAKNPMLGNLARKGAELAVNKVGSATNAFGVKRQPRQKYGGNLLTEFDMSYGTPLNPALPAQDQSRPNFELGQQLRKVSHAEKGSTQAKEWAARMRAAKAAKRGARGSGFMPAGSY